MKCIAIILLYLSPCQDSDSVSATYPRVATAISRHESGNGKSKLAKNQNNLFGFKGGTRAIGRTRNGYSIYKSKQDSWLDYIDFEKRKIEKHNLYTEKKYLSYLAKIYTKQDKNWMNKIKKYL